MHIHQLGSIPTCVCGQVFIADFWHLFMAKYRLIFSHTFYKTKHTEAHLSWANSEMFESTLTMTIYAVIENILMDLSANEIICLHLCLLSLSSPDYGRYISKRKSTFGDRWGKHVIFRKKRNYFFTWISLQFQFFEMFVVANCVFSCFGRTFHKINFVSGESQQFRRNNLSALHTNSIKWKDMLKIFGWKKWTISISLLFQQLQKNYFIWNGGHCKFVLCFISGLAGRNRL